MVEHVLFGEKYKKIQLQKRKKSGMLTQLIFEKSIHVQLNK